MALAHIVAAITVGLYLAAGEKALWELLALARDHTWQVVAADRLTTVRTVAMTLSVTLMVVGEALRSSRRAAQFREVRPPLLRVVARGLVRRGPPVPFTSG